MFRDTKILTVESTGEGKAMLTISDEDYPLVAGERYKLVRSDDGFSLRLLPGQCDTIERIWMDKECGRIFEILQEWNPESQKEVRVLQRIIESSFRYTWMHHIMKTLDLTVEDMQPLFALYSAEIDEYNSIMEKLQHR